MRIFEPRVPLGYTYQIVMQYNVQLGFVVVYNTESPEGVCEQRCAFVRDRDGSTVWDNIINGYRKRRK